jgi:hypothetical protein
MIEPPSDWQMRRAQARMNALSLSETDPSAAQAQATILDVLKDLMNNAPETAEDSFTQADGAASIANRLRERGLTEWAIAFESRASLGQSLEPNACAIEIMIGRAAGLLCGTSPGEREFTFVRHMREVIPFESADFTLATEQALKSGAGRINALAAMLNQRATNFRSEPRRSASVSDRELTQLAHEQSWGTRFIDVWDDHLDRTMIWLHDFDAYELLRRTDYAAYLDLLEDFPLRGFPYQLLDAAYGLATTQELCLLLKHARPVFDQNGAWIKENRVAFIVLNLLAARLLDQSLEEGQPSESFKETLTEIVDALIARSDATPLAYAWLQRVLMSPGKSRRRPAMKDDANLIEALLLVAANLAPHVGPHPDSLVWIEAELFVWRNWRIYALLAVEICRQPMDKSAIADLIAQTLLRDLASSTGIDRLGAPNIERRVMSLAVAKIPDLTNWFVELWERLFWQRSHFRWLGHNDVARPNVGQIIVLWALCALTLLHASPNEARSLWLAIHQAVRESILMDAFRQPNDAWSIALRFLGALWPKIFPNELPDGTPGSLETFIAPWKQIDADFAQLVEVLDRYGVRPEQLRRAGVSGEMLRRIVDDSHVRGRTILQPQEISAINVVAQKLEGIDSTA